MPSRTFRFVQASDFRLDQTPRGLAEIPDHLTEPLIEAAYRAAAAVFDLALAEEVDFVVLAGHLVEPELAGPRGPTFLTEQFSRLAARGIRVYWAAAPADGRRDWPITLVWPENVHVFDSRHIERVVHVRDGEPLCVLIGRSIDESGEHISETSDGNLTATLAPVRLAHLRALSESLAIDASAVAESTLAESTLAESTLAESTLAAGTTSPSATAAGSGLFRIAVAPLSYSAAELEAALSTIPASAPPCFLAVGGAGGSSSPVLRKQPLRVAHSSGSPQGRSIAEIGPHGATLVEVDPLTGVRMIAEATDTLRWHDERITLPASAQRAELDRQLHERMQAIIAAEPEKTLLLRWTIDGPSMLVARDRQTGLTTDLLVMLRTEYGRRTPAAWTISVAAEPPVTLPESWYAQQTLLGEYLRSVRALAESGSTGPDLHRYIPEHLKSGHFAAGLSLEDPTLRAATMQEAARLGAELLRPGEVCALFMTLGCLKLMAKNTSPTRERGRRALVLHSVLAHASGLCIEGKPTGSASNRPRIKHVA